MCERTDEVFDSVAQVSAVDRAGIDLIEDVQDGHVPPVEICE